MILLYCYIVLYYIILYIFYRSICCIYKYLVQHVETSRAIQGHPQNVTPVVLQGKKTRQDTPGMCKLPVAFWKKTRLKSWVKEGKTCRNVQETLHISSCVLFSFHVFVPLFCHCHLFSMMSTWFLPSISPIKKPSPDEVPAGEGAARFGALGWNIMEYLSENRAYLLNGRPLNGETDDQPMGFEVPYFQATQMAEDSPGAGTSPSWIEGPTQVNVPNGLWRCVAYGCTWSYGGFSKWRGAKMIPKKRGPP